ncbi:MAG: hypothetical protein KKH04_07210, partial [Proteobacteria bacterium]|nr:hypothetical protein [Pseudomonadota bacterium]
PVTRINAKLGSDGRLTLSGWLFNQLDSPDFAWRTKNSLWGGLNIQKRELCVKGILAQDLGFVWGAFQRGFGGF